MVKVKNLFKRLEYYTSIDEMPIYNWFKVNETNDLRWVAKDSNADVSKHTMKLLDAWNKIFDQFVDTFGIPEKLKEILELKRDIFVLKAQLVLSNNRTLQLFIDIETEKLEKLLSKEKNQATTNVKVYVEKFLGFKLDDKKTTVKEFYEYLMALNEQAKQENGRR